MAITRSPTASLPLACARYNPTGALSDRFQITPGKGLQTIVNKMATTAMAIAIRTNAIRISGRDLAAGARPHADTECKGVAFHSRTVDCAHGANALVQLLLDRSQALDNIDGLKSAIATSFTDARPLAHNGFKIELAQRVALRALQTAGERA